MRSMREAFESAFPRSVTISFEMCIAKLWGGFEAVPLRHHLEYEAGASFVSLFLPDSLRNQASLVVNAAFWPLTPRRQTQTSHGGALHRGVSRLMIYDQHIGPYS